MRRLIKILLIIVIIIAVPIMGLIFYLKHSITTEDVSASQYINQLMPNLVSKWDAESFLKYAASDNKVTLDDPISLQDMQTQYKQKPSSQQKHSEEVKGSPDLLRQLFSKVSKQTGALQQYQPLKCHDMGMVYCFSLVPSRFENENIWLLVFLTKDRSATYAIDQLSIVPVIKINTANKVPNASDHPCPDFHYATHSSSTPSLPQEFADKARDALSACLPFARTDKPFVLCAHLAMDGSINTVNLSSDATQQAKNDPSFADAAQRAITDVKKNCGPFNFLPNQYYNSWKELELTIIPQ